MNAMQSEKDITDRLQASNKKDFFFNVLTWKSVNSGEMDVEKSNVHVRNEYEIISRELLLLLRLLNFTNILAV